MSVMAKKKSTNRVKATCFSLFSKSLGFSRIHLANASALSLTV